jgi:predicted  nucleic acid-binding Zn-ribbon protein
MAWFRNFYRCERCGHEWADEWTATCDDDCPRCGARHMSPFKSEDIPSPKNGRRIRPATQRQSIDLQIVVARLKDAREYAKRSGCPSTLKKIRSALKSAEGAQRHMIRRLSAASP